MKILVTGATGGLGGAVIDSLLKIKGPENIFALVRDEKKADLLKSSGVNVRIGDYSDRNSLLTAFKDMDKLLLISSNGQNALNDHANAIDAAKDAGVSHIFYTSGALNRNVDDTKLGPLYSSYVTSETLIKESGMTFTIFQNSLYSETLEFFLNKDVLETGVYFPAGNGKASFAKREEMGEAIANVLSGDVHNDKTYKTTGNQTYSFGDIASLLGSLSGREVSYYSPDKDVFELKLREYGVNEEDIWFSSLFAEIIKNDEYDVAGDDLEQLLGRKPIDLKTYLLEKFIRK